MGRLAAAPGSGASHTKVQHTPLFLLLMTLSSLRIGPFPRQCSWSLSILMTLDSGMAPPSQTIWPLMVPQDFSPLSAAGLGFAAASRLLSAAGDGSTGEQLLAFWHALRLARATSTASWEHKRPEK